MSILGNLNFRFKAFNNFNNFYQSTLKSAWLLFEKCTDFPGFQIKKILETNSHTIFKNIPSTCMYFCQVLLNDYDNKQFFYYYIQLVLFIFGSVRTLACNSRDPVVATVV